MDQFQRIAQFQDSLRAAGEDLKADLWTALPGIIESFNAAPSPAGQITCRVQPAIKASIQQQDGSYQSCPLPVLVDVPVVFQRGGGVTLTFPIQEGDECLVIFASRSIDWWWQNGGVQMPGEYRMHDLSDGFAIVGPFSQKTKIANINPNAAELRTNDGNAVISINPTTWQIEVTTTTSVTVNSEYVSINGNVDVSENLTVGNGASGTFTSMDGQTITVQDGIITNIY